MDWVDGAVKLVTVLSPIALAVLAYLTVKANAIAIATAKQADQNAKRAAVAVEHVETALATTTGQTTKQLGEIHELVNSRLTIALEWARELEQMLFDATGRPPTGEPPARKS